MTEDFRVGDWKVFAAAGILRSADQQVQLELLVMDLLVCLADHSDEVLSKERLIKSIWPDSFVADDVLTSAIWKLRQALGDDSKNPTYIQTIPRRGYRLVAEVVYPSVEEELSDRFQILNKIGHGAMGEVYLAQDTELDRKVP